MSWVLVIDCTTMGASPPMMSAADIDGGNKRVMGKELGWSWA
jgi:hypothetical protein